MKKITFYSLISLSVLLFACSKDDAPDNRITVQSEQRTLYYGEEFQIKATSGLPITYTSDDKFHAKVSKAGLVTAQFVGKTQILLSNENDTKEVSINVAAKSNLYPKPNLDFGSSRSSLIKNLGTPDAETEEVVGYENYANAAPMVMYLFDETDKMEAAVVLVSTYYSSDLGTYLSERFLLMDPDLFIFINALSLADTSMMVHLQPYDENFWMVFYVPFTSSTKDTHLKNKSFAPKIESLYRELKK